MNIVKAVLADWDTLSMPPVSAVKEYIVASNGLFVRAEDLRIEACIPIAPAMLPGLAEVEPYARLKADRVPSVYLWSILLSARKRMPNEAMYQFGYDGQRQSNAAIPTWRCWMPGQVASQAALSFDDDGQAVIDLHSHNSMAAFFSTTDDADEGGLRFYAVVGRLDTDKPEIRVRVGVYGHHWDVPAKAVFECEGPFVDRYGQDDEPHCRVCGCSEFDACEGGCYWVEPGLCSRCADLEGDKS